MHLTALNERSGPRFSYAGGAALASRQPAQSNRPATRASNTSAGFAMGLAIGLTFAKIACSIMRSLVFGAKVDEPLAFAFSAFVSIAVALLATYLPARRAARIDPMNALRND